MSRRAVPGVAIALAFATLYVGVMWGSTVAGGADSYGYVSEAGLLRQGHLFIHEEIIRPSPWPGAVNTWAPLGYRESPGVRDAIVPLYPPGLPLLMALFQLIGGFCAAFLVVPISGAVVVWSTYALGQRVFGRPRVSLAAAVLVATSPIVLYQLMNPMSDVPVTAAWALAMLFASNGWPGAAGIAVSVAILIRPNLAPVALVLLAWLALTRSSFFAILRFVGGVLPGVIVVSMINSTLYGAPWLMGYGSASDLYALAHLSTNARQFFQSLMETETPLVALALAYPFARRTEQGACVRFPGWLLGGVIVAIIASYAFYRPFGAWWYLRFLLPMWPALMLLVAATVDGLAGRLHAKAPATALGLLAVGLGVYGVRTAAARSTFEIGRGEWRYIDVARFIGSHTDRDAVIISAQHSGSLRMYADRLTLRFDQLDPLWLDRVVAYLQEQHRHPYIVLEGEEVDAFRNQFAPHSEIGRLDWRPIATYASPRVVVYDAVDRAGTAEPLAIASPSRRAVWRCDPPKVWPTPTRMK